MNWNALGLSWGIARRRPFSLLMQVTNRCNLQCGFCAFWSNPAAAHEELTLDDYRRVEEQLTGLGRFLISIEGGEPLLRSDLGEIVSLFARRHLVVLYTNGWFVDQTVASDLFQRGLAQVGVSIDFPDPERHDAQRGKVGTWSRAWRAVDALRDAARDGERQVHVISVLMRANQHDIEPLLEQSRVHGVGHYLTLLSKRGAYRGDGEEMPVTPLSGSLLALWSKHRHLRGFRDYLLGVDAFLDGGELPRCRVGRQNLNLDHRGNVAACIERIDQPGGNVRQEPLVAILERLAVQDVGRTCRDCWTLCRSFPQFLGDGGNRRAWLDLAGRMRSV